MSTTKDRARAHARRAWKCPLCGGTFFGNGGRASHQRAHMRQAGIEATTIQRAGHRHAWVMFYQAHMDEQSRQGGEP